MLGAGGFIVAAHTMNKPDPAAPLAGTLLYIEDMPSAVLEVQALLARHHPGVQLLHAATGLAGVQMVHSLQPDFVLLDMHLPDIGGLEVVRRLSAHIGEQGLRVAILTGDSLTMDIIKAMSLGAWEYWVKPLQHSVLHAGLRRALTAARPDPAHRLAAPRYSGAANSRTQ